MVTNTHPPLSLVCQQLPHPLAFTPLTYSHPTVWITLFSWTASTILVVFIRDNLFKHGSFGPWVVSSLSLSLVTCKKWYKKYPFTVGVIKNASLLKNVRNFGDFLFVIRWQIICIWKGFFYTQHKEAIKEGRKVEPFLKYKMFFKVVSPKYHWGL